MSKPNFINHEIVFNPTRNELDDFRGELLGSYQLVKIEDYEYKFIKQPQLTILKSIAEKADKTDLDKIYCCGAQEFYWLFGHEHDKYVPIIFAYLAGKALGVDLVKVGEG